jgi:flagellin
MAYAVGGNSRIRTNIPAENAYNALDTSNRNISLRQLRLSTSKRINNAADDVAGYITSRALIARNGSLKAAQRAVGDAQNISYIVMDAFDNISSLLTQVKESTATAASGAMGTDEKVALAKAAYRLVQQIQTITDSTVFGGRQLIDGTFSADFVIATTATHSLITMSIDLTTGNPDYNVASNDFNLNSLTVGSFAGISNLDMKSFNNVSSDDLGVFSSSQISLTLVSLSDAIDNVNKAATYVGGLVNRLTSQEDSLKSQITNYNSAISRIEDSDVAQEQLELVKAQFLQNASLVSLAQANQNPSQFLKLIQG